MSQKMTPWRSRSSRLRWKTASLVLGGHTGQVLALGLGDAQLLVGVLDRVRKLVPLVDLRIGGLDVVVDVVDVDLRHVAAPGRHGSLLEVPERREAVVEHPVGLALHPRHLADDLLVQALLGLEDVVLLVGPAELVAPQVEIGDCHVRPLRGQEVVA
jgi:hypothetical protein